MSNATSSIHFHDIPLFRGIPAVELQHIQSCLTEKRIAKGQLLYGEGEDCNRILIVKSGRIKVFKVSSGGREQILDILKPGDTCACNPGAQSWCCSSSSQAMEDSVVWYLSRENYTTLVQTNSQLSRSLMQLLAERLCRFGCLIEQVSLNDTQKRLAKFILDMKENSVAIKGKNNIVSIPFTREEIAQRVGSTRETVTRQLNSLKKARLIEVRPKAILILNVGGLKKVAA